MDLIINPAAKDQEVQMGLPPASTYWEGKASVSGRQNRTPVAGNAYVELSGYVEPEPVEWMQRH
jgi:predicted secreted hydrolase